MAEYIKRIRTKNGDKQIDYEAIGNPPNIPQKMKYGESVWFGDSMTNGTANDNYSFVDIAKESGLFKKVTKVAHGGTIGPYGSDTEYNLLGAIPLFKNEIKAADKVFLEYCTNDLIAAMSGAVQLGTISDTSDKTTICGYLRKAIEMIYALNVNAEIVFLTLTGDKRIMEKFAENFSKDENEKNIVLNSIIEWNTVVVSILMEYGIKVIGLYDDTNHNEITMPKRLGSDGQHPNTAMYKMFFKNIINSMDTSRPVIPYKEEKILIVNIKANWSVDGTCTSSMGSKAINDEYKKGRVPVFYFTGDVNMQLIPQQIHDDGALFTNLQVEEGVLKESKVIVLPDKNVIMTIEPVTLA